MKRNSGFDEVMIVNPYDPRDHHQQTKFMRFHEAPEMGFYAEPPEMGYYGEPPEAYGYYGAPPEFGYYGAPEAYGYYGEPPPEMGYYAAPPPPPPELGWYAEGPEMGYYGEPEMYGEWDEAPEMVGYSEYEPLSEEYPGVAGYAEQDFAGYVREQRRPVYNPGCPIPTNVAGFAEAAPLEGYVRPGTVNPTVEHFVPQPGPGASLPDTFRPLW